MIDLGQALKDSINVCVKIAGQVRRIFRETSEKYLKTVKHILCQSDFTWNQDWHVTVWRFSKFPATQILCEIIFWVISEGQELPF